MLVETGQRAGQGARDHEGLGRELRYGRGTNSTEAWRAGEKLGVVQDWGVPAVGGIVSQR